MEKNIFNQIISTNDLIIRVALKEYLKEYHSQDRELRIIEELGVGNGIARIDIAVINSVMHGYEIKSDRDNLERLPEQISEFNPVFDKLTLVVGKRLLYDAINLVPNWWGIVLAKIDSNNRVVFHNIREAEDNQTQIRLSIARLLWRREALQILEEQDKAAGVRSKPREFIYERLANTLDNDNLKERVRHALLVARGDWRSDVPSVLNGD